MRAQRFPFLIATPTDFFYQHIYSHNFNTFWKLALNKNAIDNKQTPLEFYGEHFMDLFEKLVDPVPENRPSYQ